jgi:hypothetical protein
MLYGEEYEQVKLLHQPTVIVTARALKGQRVVLASLASLELYTHGK